MLQLHENRRSRAQLEYVSRGLATMNKLNFVLYSAARCYWYCEASTNLPLRGEIMDSLFIFGFNTRLAQDRINDALYSNGHFNDVIPCINIATRCLRVVTNVINLHHRSNLDLISLHYDLRILHDNAKISFAALSWARSDMLLAEMMVERSLNDQCGTAPMDVEPLIPQDLSNAIRLNAQRVRQNMQITISRL